MTSIYIKLADSTNGVHCGRGYCKGFLGGGKIIAAGELLLVIKKILFISDLCIV